MKDILGRQFYSRTKSLPVSPKVIAIVLGVIIFVGILFVFKNATNTNTNSASSQKPSAPIVKAKQGINKEFNFPIKDVDGKEISKIKYFISSASLQDEILVKGERARAVKGRTFLILDLKITNPYKQGVQINSRDYVRLVVNNKLSELIAADIHNDPVEVQAIATKSTRIGFPINEADHNLDIQVGEINGSKTTVKLTVNK